MTCLLAPYTHELDYFRTWEICREYSLRRYYFPVWMEFWGIDVAIKKLNKELETSCLG